MIQSLSHAPAQPAPTRSPSVPRAVVVTALLVAVVPALVFLAGIPLQDTSPGPCDEYGWCEDSARDHWLWNGAGWARTGVMLGVFILAAAKVGMWLRERPTALRRGSIAALCVLLPVTALFGVVMFVVWGSDCSGGGILCFGGPSDALMLGSPGIVSAVVSVLLAAGLVRRDTRGGQVLTTVVLAGLGAAIIATLAGIIADHLFSSVVYALV